MLTRPGQAPAATSGPRTAATGSVDMFRTEQMETMMSAGQQGELTHATISPQGRQHTAETRPDAPQDDQLPKPPA